MWALEADPYQVDVVFYACNRAMTSEAYANIPASDRLTEEEVKQYEPRYSPKEDLAWGPYFPNLCAYLSDYEIKQNRKGQEQAKSGMDAFNI